MIVLKRVVILIFFMVTILSSKEDYFFSFIDENSNQISQKDKDTISDGFLRLNQIEQLLKDGQIQEASTQLQNFKSRTNIEMLKSRMILLEAQIGLKLNEREELSKSEKLLEEAINRSYINEDDLPKAYIVLIELKIALNKDEETKFFIDILSNNFNAQILKAYGAIYTARLYVKKQDYKRAIATLYKVLSSTNELNVATMVAYELFDIYILDKQREEAYELMSKVVDTNIDYYANDQYLVMEKIEKLSNNSMYDLAAKTLQNVLDRATNIEALALYKFELAQIYMNMYVRGDNQLLDKAQELYSEVLNNYPNGKNSEEAKMTIDEILMREQKISPAIVNTKYPENDKMREKVLLQELLNYLEKEEYETILKSQSIYKTISRDVLNRFGYKDLNEILNQVKLSLLEEYISTGRCKELDEILNSSMQTALEQVIYKPKLQEMFFECMLENPSDINYKMVKDTLFDARDSQAYLHLENLALNFGKYDDAMIFSKKIDMLDDKEFLEKEFLLKFQIVNALDNLVEQKRFFIYAQNNPNLIEANLTNPMIIDFYNKYYYYLLDNNQPQEALKILNDLYNKQKEFKIHIYSPIVEKELARYEKDTNKDYQKALKYLQEGLTNTRNVKNNDLAQIYYDMVKLYELTNETVLYDETLQKCKEIDPTTTTTLYKKLCDEM